MGILVDLTPADRVHLVLGIYAFAWLLTVWAEIAL